MNLLPRHESDEVLAQLGFRCLAPQRFTTMDGTQITIHAAAWILKEKRLPEDEAEAKSLRSYTIYSDCGTQELDEHDVIALVGETQWASAPYS